MTLSIQIDKTVSWVPEVLCGIYCGTTKRLTTLLRYITNSYLAYVAERVPRCMKSVPTPNWPSIVAIEPLKWAMAWRSFAPVLPVGSLIDRARAGQRLT